MLVRHGDAADNECDHVSSWRYCTCCRNKRPVGMGVGATKPRVGRIGRNDRKVACYDRCQTGGCSMTEGAPSVVSVNAAAVSNKTDRNCRCKAYVVMAGAASFPTGFVLPVVGLRGSIVALDAVASILRVGDFVEQDAGIIVACKFQSLHFPMRLLALAIVDLMNQGDQLALRKASSRRCRLTGDVNLADNEIGAAGQRTGSIRGRCRSAVCTLIGVADHAVFRVNTTAVRGGSAELIVACITSTRRNDVVGRCAGESWQVCRYEVLDDVDCPVIERAAGNTSGDLDRQALGRVRIKGDGGDRRQVRGEGVYVATGTI